LTRTRRQIAQQRRNKETGSSISEPGFVLVGILRRPHGLRGEAQVSIETDFPERLKKGTRLFLGDERQPVTIRSSRTANDGLLIAFEEYPDRNSIEHIRNAPMFSRIEDSPALPEGKYYRYQLVGLTVVSDEGKELGRVTQILDTSANDIYVVQPEAGGEILLPSISDVIKSVDLEKKQITVHLLPGLLPEE
jgi:16S rRNA processing protein RimM